MPESWHTYLPQRIIGGTIRPEGLEISSREKKGLIPWNSFRLLCLGLVEEPALEPPSNFYLQIKEAIKNVFSSEEKKIKDARKRQVLYLEIFALEEEHPFRVESTSIDYRGFIEKVEYVSDANFLSFLKNLVDRVPDCVLDESVHAFLANKKSNVRRFASLYDFQRECQERWLKQREVGE